MTVSTGKALEHDADGKLRNMQVQSRARVFGAQFETPADPSNPKYTASIESAISITKQEREGWNGVKTEAFPSGDFVGAGKAAMYISGLYMELDDFNQALAWCVQAARDFRKGSSENAEVDINMNFILLHMDNEREIHYMMRVFSSWVACVLEAKVQKGEIVMEVQEGEIVMKHLEL